MSIKHGLLKRRKVHLWIKWMMFHGSVFVRMEEKWNMDIVFALLVDEKSTFVTPLLFVDQEADRRISLIRTLTFKLWCELYMFQPKPQRPWMKLLCWHGVFFSWQN